MRILDPQRSPGTSGSRPPATHRIPFHAPGSLAATTLATLSNSELERVNDIAGYFGLVRTHCPVGAGAHHASVLRMQAPDTGVQVHPDPCGVAPMVRPSRPSVTPVTARHTHSVRRVPGCTEAHIDTYRTGVQARPTMLLTTCNPRGRGQFSMCVNSFAATSVWNSRSIDVSMFPSLSEAVKWGCEKPGNAEKLAVPRWAGVAVGFGLVHLATRRSSDRPAQQVPPSVSSSRGVHPRQDGMLTGRLKGEAAFMGKGPACHLNAAISTSQPLLLPLEVLLARRHLKWNSHNGVLADAKVRTTWHNQRGIWSTRLIGACCAMEPPRTYSMFCSASKAVIRYTWWPASSAFKRFRLDGRREMLRALYPHLRAEYARWVNRSFDAKAGCVWQACHDDGEENSIGLDGCRPTINAALYGEAIALSRISDALGLADEATAYRTEARRWKNAVLSLWSAELEFFVTRAVPPPGGRLKDLKSRRTQVGCQYCTSRDCPPRWAHGALVRVRDLGGLSWPFYHGAASPAHAVAWRQFRQEGGFAAPWGLTTAERRHRCFNFTTWCQTSWHASLAFELRRSPPGQEALHDGVLRNAIQSQAGVHPAHFCDALSQYARMHTKGVADEVPAGQPFVGESFHPVDGYWLTRRIMFERRTGDRRRGDHYLHSSFADLVLSGLVGLYVTLDNDDERRGRADDAHSPVRPVRIVIDPLFETGQLHWFLARSIRAGTPSSGIRCRWLALLAWSDCQSGWTESRPRRPSNAFRVPSMTCARDVYFFSSNTPGACTVW